MKYFILQPISANFIFFPFLFPIRKLLRTCKKTIYHYYYFFIK